MRKAIADGGESLTKMDQKNVVATALRQYDLAKTGFNGGALFDAIISKATPQQMQAIIGDKQGGRAVMLLASSGFGRDARATAPGFRQCAGFQPLRRSE